MNRFLVFFFFSVFLSVQCLGNTNELSEDIARLRAEVESLNNEVKLKQKENLAELDSVLGRQRDLRAQISREQLRKLQIETKLLTLKRIEEKKASQSFDSEKNKNFSSEKKLQEWALVLEDSISESLPFQKEKRQKQVTSLIERIKNHSPAHLIALDLWQMTEDELKLSRELAYQIMPIQVNSEVIQAEVLRLGMVDMYFFATNGKAGKAFREKNQSWSLRYLPDSEVESVRSAISQFKSSKTSTFIEVSPSGGLL